MCAGAVPGPIQGLWGAAPAGWGAEKTNGGGGGGGAGESRWALVSPLAAAVAGYFTTTPKILFKMKENHGCCERAQGRRGEFIIPNWVPPPPNAAVMKCFINGRCCGLGLNVPAPEHAISSGSQPWHSHAPSSPHSPPQPPNQPPGSTQPPPPVAWTTAPQFTVSLVPQLAPTGCAPPSPGRTHPEPSSDSDTGSSLAANGDLPLLRICSCRSYKSHWLLAGRNGNHHKKFIPTKANKQ